MTTYPLETPPTAAEGDGSYSESADDGTVTTWWTDGTTRVDYDDGSSMITFADGAVLNLYPDGTRTFNDASGAALDPYTGAPLGDLTAPAFGADRVLRMLEGIEAVNNVDEAIGLVETFADAVAGEVDPTEWVEQVVNAVLHVIKALQTEERGCFVRGWCYGLLYGSLDLGRPPEPSFSGSLGGPEQDELDLGAWRSGVDQAVVDLTNGAEGIAVRNKVLFRIALDGGDATTTLRRTWQAACESSDDHALAAAYDALTWPEPVGA